MQNRTKQTSTNKTTITIIICIVVTAFALSYAAGERKNALMVQYAAENDCAWQYNGTWYGDDRDYTCK